LETFPQAILQLSIHGMREPFLGTSTLKTIINHGTSNIPNAIRIGGSVAFKNDQQDHSRLEHYDLIRLSNPGMNLARGWAWQRANHSGRQACKPSSNNIRGTSCIIPSNKAK
jgi:hypothetical protein